MTKLREALLKLREKLLTRGGKLWRYDGKMHGDTEGGFYEELEIDPEALDKEIDELCAKFESKQA